MRRDADSAMSVDRFFQLHESGSTVRTEIVAGATTFAALS